MLVAIGSLAGSPGASTIALELAVRWPRPCLVVEADPDGGRFAARLGLVLRPGLAELAAASVGDHRRGDHSTLGQPWRHLRVAPAHPAADQVTRLLARAACTVAQHCRRLPDIDTLIDVGRYHPDSPALTLVRSADRRVLVTRTDAADVVALTHRKLLLDAVGGVELVLTTGTYQPLDVQHVTGWPVTGRLDPRRSGRRDRRALQQLALDVSASTVDRHGVAPVPEPAR